MGGDPPGCRRPNHHHPHARRLRARRTRRHSPDLCAATGPIFDIKETFAQSFLLGIVTLVLGWVLFGWSLIRAAVLPANAGRLMIVGAFVFGVMPPPMTHLPFGISVFGGVLLSIGISWAGFAVWTGVGELD
jgi:hypothetical protein